MCECREPKAWDYKCGPYGCQNLTIDRRTKPLLTIVEDAA